MKNRKHKTRLKDEQKLKVVTTIFERVWDDQEIQN